MRRSMTGIAVTDAHGWKATLSTKGTVWLRIDLGAGPEWLPVASLLDRRETERQKKLTIRTR
jgi:hypothetical protein